MPESQRLDGEFTFVYWGRALPRPPVRGASRPLGRPALVPLPRCAPPRPALRSLRCGACLSRCVALRLSVLRGRSLPFKLRLAPPSRARRPPARFGVAVRLRAVGCSAVSRSRAPCGRVPPPRWRVGRYSIAPYCCGRCRPLAALLDGSLSLVFAPAALSPRLSASTSAFSPAPPLFPVKKS